MASVVVGYVPKPEGEAALLRAVEEARLRGGDLVVVNAVRSDESDPERVRKSEADLAAVSERLDAAGVGYEVRRQTDEGHGAADELVAIAEEVEAGLVVIGVRRRSATGKLILGTQAQRILLDAPCPVLVVKD